MILEKVMGVLIPSSCGGNDSTEDRCHRGCGFTADHCDPEDPEIESDESTADDQQRDHERGLRPDHEDDEPREG